MTTRPEYWTLRKHAPVPNWIRPDLSNEEEELRRVLKNFVGIEPSIENILKLTEALNTPPLTELTSERWAKLENTDSFHKIKKGDFKRVGELVEKYNTDLPEGHKRSLQRILDGFYNNQPMEVPTILENEVGSIHLISGNTRLMTARALGITPRVIIGKW